MKTFIQYKVNCTQGEESEKIIALLSGLGLDGFEELDSGISATADASMISQKEIEGLLDELGVGYHKEEIPDQNWNALWEGNFSPVVIGEFACVRAHFHTPVKGVRHDILITPKMSFGTGHHATTHLMIQMMQSLPMEGSRVFDFGTGTAVLAILASKMGAKEVEAIDNDSWSINNGNENFEANGIRNFKLHLAESPLGFEPADIVLANINKNIILQNAAILTNLVKPNGCLVLSGLLTDDESDIELEFNKLNFRKTRQMEMRGWISLEFRVS